MNDTKFLCEEKCAIDIYDYFFVEEKMRKIVLESWSRFYLYDKNEKWATNDFLNTNKTHFIRADEEDLYYDVIVLFDETIINKKKEGCEIKMIFLEM